MDMLTEIKGAEQAAEEKKAEAKGRAKVLLEEAQTAAQKQVQEWEQSIRDRELAEKRRKAPGYLDTGIALLQPEKPLYGHEASWYHWKDASLRLHSLRSHQKKNRPCMRSTRASVTRCRHLALFFSRKGASRIESGLSIWVRLILVCGLYPFLEFVYLRHAITAQA